MKKKQHFCLLKVTPYVFHYLMSNYRVNTHDCPNTVNISPSPTLRKVLMSMIKNPTNRYDKRQHGYKYTNRTCTIQIVIPDGTHSGWLLSPTDASDFALLLERQCHAMMITYINMHMIFCSTLKECVLKFQQQFGYDEDSWSYDTIRRIWNRDKTFDRYRFRQFVENEINNIYLVQMKRTGLLYKQLKPNENENY